MFCQKCGTQLNDNAKFCSKCGNQVAFFENRNNFQNQQFAKPNFKGIYRYDFWGNKKEVRCPRCRSEECSHYKEEQIIKGKAKYTPNLNPLKPFTLVNKKENFKTQTVSRFMCNKCGKIFD